MKRIYIFIVFFILLLSCSKESLFYGTPPQTEGYNLEIVCETTSEKDMARSQNTAKEEKEKKINNIYIFFFDKEGKKLVPLNPDLYRHYIYREFYDYDNNSTALVVIPKNMFNNHEKAGSAKVYVVANIEKGCFDPEMIEDEETLLDYSYCPTGEKERNLEELPVDGMPMFGQCVTSEGNTLLNLTLDNNADGKQATAQATATLKAMMARIDIKLSINSDKTDASGKLPTLDLTQWGICNVPDGARFSKSEKSPDTTDIPSIGCRDVMYQLPVKNLINNGKSRKVSLYMFENLQNPKALHYPVGIKEGQKQRYKPLFANGYASAFIFQGNYTSYNGMENVARFKFYLGGNNADDFKVTRNCHYKNNIDIHGIVANDKTIDETNVTFDARVNINDDANYYFIKMLREREHDSHYCVTPIDFYLLKPAGYNPRIKIEIPEDCDWIRLEMIPAVNMKNHDLPEGFDPECHLKKDTPFCEGHGKRKYFTTDLLTDPGQLSTSTSCVVKTDRDRVYLYVDENISRYDRTTHLTLTYTDDQTTEVVRQIEIGQHGLLEVRQMEDGEDQYGRLSGKYFYIEYTEEYLNSYDPLCRYNSSSLYEGLPYGYYGKYISELSADSNVIDPNYNIKGYNMGLRICQQIYNGIAGKPCITLDEKPQNAVLYCYTKNKCDRDGIIRGIEPVSSDASPEKKAEYTGWALPGSRQLERAMTEYYNVFTDFQGNYYWSATPGNWKKYFFDKKPNNENAATARATKFVGEGAEHASKLGYLESDYTHPYETYVYNEGFYPITYTGGGGWASRKKNFRVRAIYYYHGGERLPF